MGQVWCRRILFSRSKHTSCRSIDYFESQFRQQFCLPVVPALQVQEQDPFLILQDTSQQQQQRTWGLWFHSADERIALTRELQTVVTQIANHTFVFPTAATPVAAPTPPTRAPTDVTQDERDHLAALLSQTALGAARSQSAPKSATTGSTPPPSVPGGSVALDKKALQLTLLSLIQDERFLDLLHSQYLHVVHARAKKNSSDGSGGAKNNTNHS